MKKIKFSKICPIEGLEASYKNCVNYCPEDLFRARKGYEQVELRFLTSVPEKPTEDCKQQRLNTNSASCSPNITNNGSSRNCESSPVLGNGTLIRVCKPFEGTDNLKTVSSKLRVVPLVHSDQGDNMTRFGTSSRQTITPERTQRLRKFFGEVREKKK